MGRKEEVKERREESIERGGGYVREIMEWEAETEILREIENIRIGDIENESTETICEEGSIETKRNR